MIDTRMVGSHSCRYLRTGVTFSFSFPFLMLGGNISLQLRKMGLRILIVNQITPTYLDTKDVGFNSMILLLDNVMFIVLVLRTGSSNDWFELLKT